MPAKCERRQGFERFLSQLSVITSKKVQQVKPVAYCTVLFSLRGKNKYFIN